MGRVLTLGLSIAVAWIAYLCATGSHWTTVYQVRAAVVGVSQLFSLPQEDIDACVEAYRYLQKGTSALAGAATDSAEETEHVRRYYKVLQPLLAIADIEKMYIPPQIDAKLGLYGNQLLHEQQWQQPPLTRTKQHSANQCSAILSHRARHQVRHGRGPVGLDLGVDR